MTMIDGKQEERKLPHLQDLMDAADREAAEGDVLDELIDRRRQVYGDPQEIFPRVAQIWSGIVGHEITAIHVALCMIGYKLARASVMPDYSDNSDDVEGYLAIFRELVGEDMISARSVSEFIHLKKWD